MDGFWYTIQGGLVLAATTLVYFIVVLPGQKHLRGRRRILNQVLVQESVYQRPSI
ncbi:hypothetical protein ACQZV8_19500 [Magnetococcales bacterium HHB-1]